MSKLINRPPKYSLHKPSRQAEVRYNGKTTYLGRHGTPESLEAYSEATVRNRLDSRADPHQTGHFIEEGSGRCGCRPRNGPLKPMGPQEFGLRFNRESCMTMRVSRCHHTIALR